MGSCLLHHVTAICYIYFKMVQILKKAIVAVKSTTHLSRIEYIGISNIAPLSVTHILVIQFNMTSWCYCIKFFIIKIAFDGNHELLQGHFTDLCVIHPSLKEHSRKANTIITWTDVRTFYFIRLHAWQYSECECSNCKNYLAFCIAYLSNLQLHMRIFLACNIVLVEMEFKGEACSRSSEIQL